MYRRTEKNKLQQKQKTCAKRDSALRLWKHLALGGYLQGQWRCHGTSHPGGFQTLQIALVEYVET